MSFLADRSDEGREDVGIANFAQRYEAFLDGSARMSVGIEGMAPEEDLENAKGRCFVKN